MAKFQVADSLDRGSFGLEHPGTFHLVVLTAEEYPQKNDGTPIKGWRITCGVLAGTDEREVGRQVELIFNHPDVSHQDQGKFAQRIQSRFLYAVMLITEDQKGKEVDIDLEKQATGRQFIARFAVDVHKGRESVKLDSINMWHVDDADVAKVPKDQAQIDTLPEALRMKNQPAASKGKTQPAKKEEKTEYAEPIPQGKPSIDWADV